VDFTTERHDDTVEEAAWRQKVRAWVEAEITPNMKEWESRDELAFDCYRKMAEFGFIAWTYPPELGGIEMPQNLQAIARQELAKAGDGPLGYLTAIPSIYGWQLDDGDPEHAEWLRSANRGEHMVAFCETEPAGGSDGAAITTRADRDGDEWVINGEKTFLSLVPGADWLIVTALTDVEAGGKRGMSLFLVPDDTPGIEMYDLHTPEVKAWHTFSGMHLRNVRVPLNHLLGEENRGFYHVKAKSWARRGGGAGRGYVLAGKEVPAFIELVEAMKERTFDGAPMLRQSWVQTRILDNFMLTEMQRMNGLKGASLQKQDSGGHGPILDRSATGFASMSMLFGKVMGRRMLMNRMALLAEDGMDGASEELKEFIVSTGSRAAGGGVDVHRIIVGQELYGPEWAVHRD
jgi:alkylation response protein AidB-like acyl-CoA dehydrogenase